MEIRLSFPAMKKPMCPLCVSRGWGGGGGGDHPNDARLLG